LTRQRSAEIYFLFENADPSAVGDQSGAIVEGVRKFTDAAIRPETRFSRLSKQRDGGRRQTQSGTDKWQITGKMAGMKGSGTCKLSPGSTDGGLDYACTVCMPMAQRLLPSSRKDLKARIAKGRP
jgi:hypothetical protein